MGDILPYSLEAEQCVLGACLLSHDALLEACDLLEPDMFYNGRHQVIFDALKIMDSEGITIDLVTVADYLMANKNDRAAGGITYLSALSDAVPAIENVPDYAGVIKDKWLRRNLWQSAQKIAKLALDETDDFSEQAAEAEQLVFCIAQGQETNTLAPFSQILSRRWEELYKSKDDPGVVGLHTHFVDLDIALGGLQPADLIVLAARPSLGKTSLAQQIGQHVAMQGKPVLIFSIEMSGNAIADRAICTEAMIDSQKMRSRRLRQDEWDKGSNAAGRLKGLPIYVDDDAGITSLEIRSRARRIKSQKGLGLVIIDFLQLISDRPERGQNRNELVGAITRRIKAAARELDVPIILLSQLNRAADGQRPTLANLRDSGEIEQVADIVLFIHQEEPGVKQIIIAKNRNGPVGTVPIGFIPHAAKFVTLDRRQAGAM